MLMHHSPLVDQPAAFWFFACRISEAYGRMILGEGLFQADGHPGNILLQKGAKIGLLDYGQSKQVRVCGGRLGAPAPGTLQQGWAAR